MPEPSPHKNRASSFEAFLLFEELDLYCSIGFLPYGVSPRGFRRESSRRIVSLRERFPCGKTPALRVLFSSFP
jgi:hypothetical protein